MPGPAACSVASVGAWVAPQRSRERPVQRVREPTRLKGELSHSALALVLLDVLLVVYTVAKSIAEQAQSSLASVGDGFLRMSQESVEAKAHLLGLLDGLSLSRILSDTVANVLQGINLIVRSMSAYLVIRAVLQKHLHDSCDAHGELAGALFNL